MSQPASCCQSGWAEAICSPTTAYTQREVGCASTVIGTVGAQLYVIRPSRPNPEPKASRGKSSTAELRELADAAHVTPGQISHYEHGRDRISHERVTEFARILRIKSNDLYQPPGSRLRRNHIRWRLTNFMAAVIAEAAALMSSWRRAAAD